MQGPTSRAGIYGDEKYDRSEMPFPAVYEQVCGLLYVALVISRIVGLIIARQRADHHAGETARYAAARRL